MPRNYVRRGTKQLDRTNLEAAFKHRVANKCSIKAASDKFGVKKTTLVNAFSRSKALSDGLTYVPLKPHSRRVFTPQQELYIVEYTIQAAKMFCGLSMNELRRMIYQHAKDCGSQTIPVTWEKDRKASRNWYYSFMARHPNLVLKAPEDRGDRESVRPLRKAAPPYGKGPERRRTFIVTEVKDGITDLRMKTEKREKIEEEKAAAAENKALGEKKECVRHRKSVPVEEDSEEKDVDDVPMQCNDSSVYSDEVQDKCNGTQLSYPCTEKAPQADEGAASDQVGCLITEEFVVKEEMDDLLPMESVSSGYTSTPPTPSSSTSTPPSPSPSTNGSFPQLTSFLDNPRKTEQICDHEKLHDLSATTTTLDEFVVWVTEPQTQPPPPAKQQPPDIIQKTVTLISNYMSMFNEEMKKKLAAKLLNAMFEAASPTPDDLL